MNFLYFKPASYEERESFINQTIFLFSGVVILGLIFLGLVFGSAVLEMSLAGLAMLIVVATIVYFFKNGVTGKIASSLLLVIIAFGTFYELSSINNLDVSIGTKLMDILLQLSKFYLSVRLVILIFSKLEENKLVKQTFQAGTFDNKYENLEKLKKLLDDGVITEDEFNIEKQKIMG